MEYIFDSRNESDSTVSAKRPCTDEAVVIKRCAVIKIRNHKIQRYCHDSGKPTYFEEVDVIEYWESAHGGAGQH